MGASTNRFGPNLLETGAASILALAARRTDAGGIAADADGRRVERILMWAIYWLLNRLDAAAAVFSDLVDVGALHQAHRDVGVPQDLGDTLVIMRKHVLL